MDEKKPSESSEPHVEAKVNPIDLAYVVAQQVQIQSVFLVESRTFRGPEVDNIGDGAVFEFKIRGIHFSKEESENVFYIFALFSVVLRRAAENDGSDPLVEIEATFTLVYKVNSFEGIEDQHIKAFGVTSGLFNAWPYWREFVQSSSVRMGLPPITVPIHRV